MAAPSTIDSTSPLVAAPSTSVFELIGVRPGFCGGKPHVLGHRIRVQHIAIWHHRLGMSAEEIVVDYPTLNLAKVYAALAYYHLHRAEIDADIAETDRRVAELKAASGPSLIERVRSARNAEDDSISF